MADTQAKTQTIRQVGPMGIPNKIQKQDGNI